MAHDRDTPKTGGEDASTRLLDARASVLRVAGELRQMGLNAQAEVLEKVAELLVPPTYQGILGAVDMGRPVAPRQARMMADWMVEGAGIIRELMDDAEITGSHGAWKRARAWLDRLGL